MTDHFDHDDLTDIFEDLKPEDFIQSESTAVGIVALASQDAEFVGAEAFARFIARSLNDVRVAYAASAGDINPIAILATATTQYLFVPDEDDSLGSWADRLRREAATLGATWVFITRKTMVGTSDQPADTQVGSQKAYDLAIERGDDLRPGMLFYVQRREGLEVENYCGYMQAQSDVELGEVQMGHSTQGLESLFYVLDAPR